MTDLSTEALLSRREMAERATPGPWRRLPGRSLIVSMTGEGKPLVCDVKKAADAAHIIANSPDVVIATIDELLRLREENGRLEKEADWLAQSAANAGWDGRRVSPKDMREAARRAVEEVCPKN